MVPREEVTLALRGGRRRRQGIQRAQRSQRSPKNGPDAWGQLPKTLAGAVHGPRTSLAPWTCAAETTTVFQALPVCNYFQARRLYHTLPLPVMQLSSLFTSPFGKLLRLLMFVMESPSAPCNLPRASKLMCILLQARAYIVHLGLVSGLPNNLGFARSAENQGFSLRHRIFGLSHRLPR
jgi:hypothetical protein